MEELNDGIKRGVAQVVVNQGHAETNNSERHQDSSYLRNKQTGYAIIIALTATVVTIFGTSAFHWYVGYPLSGVSEYSVRELVELHKQDTTIHKRDVAIHERDVTIHERDVTIHKKDVALHEKDVALHEKDVALHEKDVALHEKDVANYEALSKKYFSEFDLPADRRKLYEAAVKEYSK